MRGLGKSRRRSLGAARSALILTLVVGMAGLIGLASGASDALPVGTETVHEGNTDTTYIVLNPAIGAAASCGCETGTLRLVIPEQSIVWSQPSLTVGTVILGNIARGAFVCALGQNNQGAYQVRVPGNCNQSGWVMPETFQTVRVLIADGSQQATGTTVSLALPSATPVATATPTVVPTPTPSPTATPSPTPTVTPIPTSTPAPSPTPESGVSGSVGIAVLPSLTVQMVQVVGSTTSGLGLISDGGSGFTVGVETQMGSTFQLKLALKNASNSPINGALQLQVPAGVTVTATAADQVSGIARFAPDTWIFTMATGPANMTTDITLNLRVGAGAPSGFINMRGVIGQIAG